MANDLASRRGTIERDAFLIGSRWRAPEGSDWLDVISPIDEECVGRLPVSTEADIDVAVAAAKRAFDEGPWPRMSVAERGEYLLRLSALLLPRLEEVTHVQVDEMGGPYSYARPLIEAAFASPARRIEEAAAAIESRDVRDGFAGKVIVRRDPLGVVAGIVPWNTPLILLMGKLTTALLTGCTFVGKPSPESPLSAYLVADAIAEVGFPEGVVSIVAGGREVGEHLVSHPDVQKVSFTGSSAAGARVSSICGGQLKSVTMELGGKSAAIILDDADLDRLWPTVMRHAMSNTGQVCLSTTRILVSKAREREVADRLVATAEAMKIGNPHDADTNIGPLVAERQRTRVERYIRAGREDGATLLTGGGRPHGFDRGWYVEPTIFSAVDNSMRIARDEIFGPVLSVIAYDDVDDAVAIANDSDYGLGGAVYTDDVERGIAVATRIETGTCLINEGPSGGGGGPFGGVKRSGLGREGGGQAGWDAFFELKSISLPPGYEPASAT